MRGGYGQRVLPPAAYNRALGVFELEKQLEKDAKAELRQRKVMEEQEALMNKKKKQEEKIRKHT